MSGALAKAERLAVAGTVAPALRQRVGKGRAVKVTGPDGHVVRVTDDVELARGLLARADIEFSVLPGKRPKLSTCRFCGKPIEVAPKGPIPKTCKIDIKNCARCGEPLPAATRRTCRETHCRSCYIKAGRERKHASMVTATCAECGTPINYRSRSADGRRNAKSARCRSCANGVNRADVRQAMLSAIADAGGCTSKAAKLLGISNTTMRSRVKRLVDLGYLKRIEREGRDGYYDVIRMA